MRRSTRKPRLNHQTFISGVLLLTIPALMSLRTLCDLKQQLSESTQAVTPEHLCDDHDDDHATTPSSDSSPNKNCCKQISIEAVQGPLLKFTKSFSTLCYGIDVATGPKFRMMPRDFSPLIIRNAGIDYIGSSPPLYVVKSSFLI